jgi:hypothetical protein
MEARMSASTLVSDDRAAVLEQECKEACLAISRAEDVVHYLDSLAEFLAISDDHFAFEMGDYRGWLRNLQGELTNELQELLEDIALSTREIRSTGFRARTAAARAAAEAAEKEKAGVR